MAPVIPAIHGNSKFEQALAVELTPIGMLLQIPDRYGKVPHTAAARQRHSSPLRRPMTAA